MLEAPADVGVHRNVYFAVNLRCIGGEVGATSSLAPKIGPLGLVSAYLSLISNEHNLKKVAVPLFGMMLWQSL